LEISTEIASAEQITIGDKKMKEYKINIEAINSVLPAVSKEEVKYYMGGVNIEDKDGFRHYTATDGHILFTIKDEIDGDFLEKPLILKINKPLKYKNYTVGDLQVVDDETVVIKTNQEKVAVDIIDSTFPDVSRVIPPEYTPKAKEYAIFDPEYMKEVNKFIGTKGKIPLMENAKSPALWIEGNKKAVLMPMNEK
jgi:hypothetical protein